MKYSDVPILMYHDLGEFDSLWCVSVNEFEKQMQYLKEQNYQTISLTELQESLNDNKETDGKKIVLTFDDARKGVYQYAYPILKNQGFTATIFVVPTWIDDQDIPEKEDYDFMSWNELQELVQNGFDIGSHTYSHKNLVTLDLVQLSRELEQADQAIKGKLNIVPQHFAYPYGKFNQEIAQTVLSRYSTALSTIKGFDKTPGQYARQWVLRETSFDGFRSLLIPKKLSLCMIVKNEEVFLEQCLQSVQGLVDEIIIVDTGSTDKTKEIAAKFTDKLFGFTWCDDFSAARTESLKYATGDWILVLDADEVIDLADIPFIKSALYEDYPAYNLVTKNYSNTSSVSGWQAANDQWTHGFAGWHPSIKIRLFQKSPQAIFQGRVHEMIPEAVFEKVGVLPFFVHHYGAERKKEGNYLELLHQKVEDQPTSKAYFELGVAYKNACQLKEAEQFLQKAVDLDSDSITPRLNLAIVQSKNSVVEKAKENFLRVLEKNPELAEAYAGLAFLFFKQNKLIPAAENWELAVKYNPQFLDGYINLGGVYESLGQFDKALGNLKTALQLSPKAARAYYNLGVVHEKCGVLPLALKCYEKALELGYKKEELWQRIVKIREFLTKHNSKEQNHG